MKLSDIPHLRLLNQQILNSKFKTSEHLVFYLGAVQSQDFYGAKWALGLRIPGSTEREINEAFNKHQILRTHVLRPTWHFVSPENIRWMLELSKPQIRRMMKYYDKKIELNDEIYKKSYDIFQKVLSRKNFLTREELSQELNNNGIHASGQRLAHIVFYSEIEGLICSGPRKGKQFTYALIDDIAPKTRPLLREESLGKLTQLFFETRGPATLKDFSKWSALSQADCKTGLDLVKPKLSNEQIDGKEYFFKTLQPATHNLSPHALLLPNYDEYISSYSDYSIISTEQTRKNLDKIGNATFWNHMVLNGNIVGSWKRIFRQKQIEIQLAPLVNLTTEELNLFKKEAQKFGEFYNLPITLL